MARVSVQLLGRPCVYVDGTETAAPKGAKAWGLLAYLAASERAHPRSELADLLFSEAVDPLGALRWNLAALRRLLHRPDALKGDAISLAEADIAVDTVQLESGQVDEPLQGPCGRELLAGLSFPDSPMFELWLAGERQRLRRRSVSLTREHSLDAFARGDHDLAIRLAKELVAAEPFDEGHHALLIRTLALSGEHDVARHQYDSCATLLRRELGIEPGPAVLAALHLVNNPVDGATEATFDEICARITVAWQSFLAGSIDHGLDMGRSTILLSDMSGDPDLAAASRLYFAGMLNMAVRGWDEAATATSEARHLASETGRVDHLALAHSITAGSELMRGDYAVALDHATAGVALDDQGALALNLAFLSAVESDTGRVETARQHAIEASDAAERSLDGVGAAYAHSYSAHIDLDAGRYDCARVHAVKAVDASSSILVLQPWPTAMLAEIEVHDGNLDAAIEAATRADGIATATGMSYQRGLAQRAIALAEAAGGDDDAALDRLVVALGHARRTAGQGYAFHWPVAWVLESLACISARSRQEDAHRWARALRDHASATGMVTFSARADRLLALTSTS